MEAIPESLIHWYNKSYRNLPWRQTKDPYLIWLSEIMLQQTRVEQGMPYYERFSERYPMVEDLARASEDQVLKDWQGLGYYSRARNMHHTAKRIVSEYGGEFPKQYKDILELKGVGPYTAAAIASFAFDLPYPVLDGNAERVISRLFGISENIKMGKGKNELKAALASIFPNKQAAVFNQAIMELGSQICKPKNPICPECPLQNQCYANEHNLQSKIPNKGKKTQAKTVTHHYFVLRFQNKTYIEQRKKGIWQQLYQFPLIEGEMKWQTALDQLREMIELSEKVELEHSYVCQHLLSHRKINAHFYTIRSEQAFQPLKSTIFEIDFRDLFDRYPVSVLIEKFLNLN